MSKRSSSSTIKGFLDVNAMELVSEDKDGNISRYDLSEELNIYHGDLITVSIKKDTTIPVIEE